MTERKHTPGPWSWDIGDLGQDSSVRYAEVYAQNGDFVFIADLNYCIPEARANAPLIAAAPEMFEALEQAYAFIADEYADAKSQALDGEHVSPEARPVWNAICAALSKARGET